MHEHARVGNIKGEERWIFPACVAFCNHANTQAVFYLTRRCAQRGVQHTVAFFLYPAGCHFDSACFLSRAP